MRGCWNKFIVFCHAFVMPNDLWQKIRARIRPDAHVLWNWAAGKGMDYLSLISYYLASPLNLISAIVPESLSLKNIASAFSCDIGQINVKGTTEEGLGFTGTGEGIAAHAVCLLQK